MKMTVGIFLVLAVFMGTVGFSSWLLLSFRHLRRHYERSFPGTPSPEFWPKAAIILCVRGKDPFLATCIRNLLAQQYQDFSIHIIIDSPGDPGWEAINEVRESFPHSRLHVSILRHRSPHCSLKNSSIIQAVNDLDDDCDIVAFVDADAITQPNWLRELVKPFADPQVGATTGVRWYSPPDHGFATRVRCWWNLLAASVIYQAEIPWGGSMAVRRSILASGLIAEWSQMFCEDVHTSGHLKARGLKVATVPTATVVNEEQTSLNCCFRFISRQMLILRLYHACWWRVAVIVALAAGVRFLHLGSVFYTGIAGDWISLLLLLSIYPMAMFPIQSGALRLDRAVRDVMARSGQQIAPNPTPRFLECRCAELLFLVSTVNALTTHFVMWRGIRYQIKGPRDINLLAYRPYVESPEVAITAPVSVV